MRANSQLKYHAKKVIDVLGRVIEKVIKSQVDQINLDDFNLLKLGANHFHYGVVRNDFSVRMQ
jgi:hypothetical protein